MVPASPESKPTTVTTSRPFLIFLAALAVRWAYVLILFAVMGEAGLKGADSVGYLELARDFAAAVATGSVHGLQWLGPSPSQMPLFTGLLLLNALAFGALAPLGYALMQGALDAGTCVLIAAMARSLDARYALPAAFAAIVNPTQIVLAGLVYSDTPFVFLVALFMLASLRWMRTPQWRWAILIGLTIGAAALIRVMAATWLPLLALFLLAVLACERRFELRQVGQLAVAAGIVAGLLGPVLWRNVSYYNAWALTPQGGEHLARHVVPFVKEVQDGTPRMDFIADVDRRRLERFGAMPSNYFEQSRQYTALGIEDLKQLGPWAAAKAWVLGAALNLGTPAILLSPPIAQLPRTGFFATPGVSPFDKIGNFLFRSGNAAYGWALLFGIAGVVIVRLIQLAGLVDALRQRSSRPALLLFGLWFCFVLAVSGPIASPKYRLPLEPPLMVLAGAGLSVLQRLRRSPGGGR